MKFAKSGPGPYTITEFVAGAAAALNGQFKIGDLLHSVDNQSVYELDPAQTTQLILGQPGTEVVFGITNPPQLEKIAAPANVREQSFVRGETGGLGIGFAKGAEWLEYVVTQLSSDGPAQRSGAIQSGEQMISVDGQLIIALTVDQVKALIVGQPGSSVIIGVAPPLQQSAAQQQPVNMMSVVVTRGDTGGIGLGFSRLTKEYTSGPFVIKKLVPAGAAEQSGQFLVGDLLCGVDVSPVHDLTLDQVKALILGPVGSTVNLTIFRPPPHEVAKMAEAATIAANAQKALKSAAIPQVSRGIVANVEVQIGQQQQEQQKQQMQIQQQVSFRAYVYMYTLIHVRVCTCTHSSM